MVYQMVLDHAKVRSISVQRSRDGSMKWPSDRVISGSEVRWSLRRLQGGLKKCGGMARGFIRWPTVWYVFREKHYFCLASGSLERRAVKESQLGSRGSRRYSTVRLQVYHVGKRTAISDKTIM
jgi:hypothetical protein